MPKYLIFLVIFFILPTLCFWIYDFKKMLQYRKVFFLTIICTFFFGVPWDLLSVKTGLWRYDSAPTLNIWFFGKPNTGLPLEELLFTFIFPIFVTSLTIVLRGRIK